MAIIQARVGSKRLPGKVLLKTAGHTLLGHTIRRLQKCKNLDQIVVATAPGKENRPIMDIASKYGILAPLIDVHEDDVLGRYVAAAKMFSAQVIVRITGDCPLIDPEIVDQTIDALGDADVATNVLPPRTFARGLDTEVVTRKCLKKLDRLCRDARREHVTLYVYNNPDMFRVNSIYDTEDNSSILLCVDYAEDFERVSRILKWNKDASYREILRKVKDESSTDGILDVDGGAARGH